MDPRQDDFRGMRKRLSDLLTGAAASRRESGHGSVLSDMTPLSESNVALSPAKLAVILVSTIDDNFPWQPVRTWAFPGSWRATGSVGCGDGRVSIHVENEQK